MHLLVLVTISNFKVFSLHHSLFEMCVHRSKQEEILHREYGVRNVVTLCMTELADILCKSTSTQRKHKIQSETQHVSMDMLAIYRPTTYHIFGHYWQCKHSSYFVADISATYPRRLYVNIKMHVKSFNISAA
jgi:hypothetical protein